MRLILILKIILSAEKSAYVIDKKWTVDSKSVSDPWKFYLGLKTYQDIDKRCRSSKN